MIAEKVETPGAARVGQVLARYTIVLEVASGISEERAQRLLDRIDALRFPEAARKKIQTYLEGARTLSGIVAHVED